MENTIHIEYQGKSAKVMFKALPTAREDLRLVQRTSTGPLATLKVVNGINADLSPFGLKPEALIQSDPELNLAQAGQVLEPESLSAAYYDPADKQRTPVSDFTLVDIVYDAQAQEKERRPHLTRKANVADIYPIKIGKRLPIAQALTQFVFRHTFQIVHEDGVTMDFLHGLAKDLHEKQEMALLGAGPKGNLPLVVRDKGNPYRGFLYGEIGEGPDKDKYKLLVLLSDQELKRPQAPAA